MENLGVEFNVTKSNLEVYNIGTFAFNYRELEENGENIIEVDVYKASGPVILYIKTYKAPYIPEASPVEMCEALYEEFYMQKEE
ncbi:hypothetical protein [Peptostreptococcus canis]|nr:hypothetical protein [Peptostreptococcus canis]MBP1998287.1 hypothetical protein [Peptostreptococcus canis]